MWSFGQALGAVAPVYTWGPGKQVTKSSASVQHDEWCACELQALHQASLFFGRTRVRTLCRRCILFCAEEVQAAEEEEKL